MAEALTDTWAGEDVRLADVEQALADLRSSGDDAQPRLRTSVMTHLAWVPPDWLDPARRALAGLAERHPSRSIILVPRPDEGVDRIDANVSVECYSVPGADRQICSEVIELELLGARAHAPASVVAPLLVPDLPVFCRWRGQPPFEAAEFEQLTGTADRLIVDSTEWPDLPRAYGGLAGVFDRVVVSDIAWARTGRWRALLASLWPDIAAVRAIRVRGTRAQAYLVAGWLRSRLGHEIALEHDDAERLEGIELDGEPAPFPPGDPPTPSELLSDELDRFTRDPVYEAAAAAAARTATSR